MAVTDVWADWSATAASNSPAGAATPEVDDELRNIKAQCKANAFTASAGGATQAQQETGTATTVFVTPGVQKYHPSACKAWVLCGIAGDIAGAFNVATVTDAGTGTVTGDFTVAFSGTANGWAASAVCAGALRLTLAYSQTATTFQIRSYSSLFALADPEGYGAVFFGDQ